MYVLHVLPVHDWYIYIRVGSGGGFGRGRAFLNLAHSNYRPAAVQVQLHCTTKADPANLVGGPYWAKDRFAPVELLRPYTVR